MGACWRAKLCIVTYSICYEAPICSESYAVMKNVFKISDHVSCHIATHSVDAFKGQLEMKVTLYAV